jgi:hypothetical protein
MVNNTRRHREIVEILEQEFASLLEGLTLFVESVPPDLLYRNFQAPGSQGPRMLAPSVGEQVLKSAAVLEQTFGGLTANLWDDPFEWTLQETLSNADRIIEYIGEVDATRQRAFACFADDAALLKYVSVPSGKPCTLLSLLLDCLVRASSHKGQAITTLKILSATELPGFII